MFDVDPWREIFQGIRKNKLRSILSGVTVAFAILLFTLLFGIGNGLQNQFKEAFRGDAFNTISIWANKTTKPYKGKKSGRRIQLKNDDFTLLKEKFGSKIQYISPKITKDAQVTYKNEGDSYGLMGIYPEYQFIEDAKVIEGRFLNRRDIEQKSKVVAIGRMVKKDLFGQLNALGKQIAINGIMYEIIGVYSDPGGDDEERNIYAPITTLQRSYGNNDYIDDLTMTYNPNLSIDNAIALGVQMKRALKEKHDISPNDQRGIWIDNMASNNKEAATMMITLGVLILIIGLGTLIAGIVGISNIMVYVVRERTKELGIRKAIGAKPSVIVAMIMQEAVFITAIAGYIGLLIGVGTLKLAKKSLEQFFILNPYVSTPVVVGATITLIISGIIAGYLPAKKAARIKPIVALRTD